MLTRKRLAENPELITPSKSFLKKSKQYSSSAKKCCPICLTSSPNVRTQCGHEFCLECIRTLIMNSNKCPCCRSKFKFYDKGGKRVEVQDMEEKIEQQENIQPCLYCETFDNLQQIVLCDMCQSIIVHTYCDVSMRGVMPNQWKCPYCVQKEQEERTRLLFSHGYRH